MLLYFHFGHLPLCCLLFWSSSILVVFHFFRLQFWSSYILLVFNFGRLKFWSSSILFVFHFGRLPFWSSFILVVFHFGSLPFWSSSILVVFLFCRLLLLNVSYFRVKKLLPLTLQLINTLEISIKKGLQTNKKINK